MPLVAFVCHFFGWTVDLCLDLPVQTFFSLYREAIRIEARQFSEMADISLCPQMKLEYYWGLKDRYRMMIDPKARELPPKPSGPVLEAGSPEAMMAMRSVAAAQKHAMGFSEGPARIGTSVRNHGRR